MAKATGTTAALDGLNMSPEPAPAPAQQLSLLPKPLLEGQEADFSPAAEPVEPRQGPGRPPGSKNRATKDVVSYLEGLNVKRPLVVLGRLWSMKPKAMVAKGYAKTVPEAVRLIAQTAIAGLPYVEHKQPVAVDLNGKGIFQLVIGDVSTADQDSIDDGLSVVLDLVANKIEVGEKVEGKSDG